ncbi:hypothetical protein CORC01_07368 [Colletotrichum orchidophilum]|uniref:Clr5 domain-containing protein n=1 Tax=Colletotrichum orchidophilum TaxID=1209926 RepID=A0A1G4B7N6_9PEZI|nr:uncharacterized protein CORC01_07368 [Colletotrichum orchidophilum]OHE97313.1 hypothetical protein CORC01_07368 [Colletotrichum orchidophilum]
MDVTREIDVVETPLVTRKPYATDEVWDCHRSIITKLYQDDKRTLKQVKQIMERDHSFYATERMFKTRLRSWGLEKKLKETEVWHIVQLNREREARGKKSEFYIRNQRVRWERLVRYLVRRPDLRRKLGTSTQTPINADLDIICRTPSPSLDLPAFLGGPPEVRLPEEMLRIFQGYFEGGLESGWAIEEDKIHGFDEEFGQLRVVEMRTGLDNAITLLWTNKLEAAFLALNNSLDSLGHSIKEQDPLLFYILAYRTLQLGPRIADTVVDFIYEMHVAMLGHRHPLALVWSKFRCLSLELRARALTLMAGSSVQLLRGQLGILNRVVALALGSTSNVLDNPGQTDGTHFSELLLKYASASESYFAEGNYQSSCECHLVVAGIYSWGQEYELTKQSLARAHFLIQDNNDSKESPERSWLRLELSYYEIMGRLSYQTGSTDEALAYGCKAYWHAAEHFQPNKHQLLRAIRNLIDICRQTGRGEEAERWCQVLLANMSGERQG